MEYGKIFRQPHLVGLWLSQIFSAIGDQLYSIAIVWIAVETSGGSAGFVAAAGTLAGLFLGLIGGVYADRWNRRTTMIVVDVLRASTVLTLAAIGHFTTLNLWHLGVASVIVSGLGALFDPALAASLPELTAGNEAQLQAMNAMMQVNHRLARTIGPAIAGWLVAVTSLHHFFTIDAITFLVSAIAIFSIGRNFKWKQERHGPVDSSIAGVWKDIARGYSILLRHEQLTWAFAMYVVANIAWSAGFILGFPLWAKHLPHSDVGTFGTLVAAYGVGSVSSNVVMGMIRSRKRMFFISMSQLFFACGFLIVASTHNLLIACLGSTLAAIGGPVGDVMMMVMLQTDMPREDLGKIYSLRQFVMYLGGSIGLIMAPALFQIAGPQIGIAISAIIFGLLGMVGLMKFGLSETPSGDFRKGSAVEVSPDQPVRGVLSEQSKSRV